MPCPKYEANVSSDTPKPLAKFKLCFKLFLVLTLPVPEEPDPLAVEDEPNNCILLSRAYWNSWGFV